MVRVPYHVSATMPVARLGATCDAGRHGTAKDRFKPATEQEMSLQATVMVLSLAAMIGYPVWIFYLKPKFGNEDKLEIE